MTDEATSHIYAMLDQLIEGHQWLRNNLGVVPKSGWSIDPFGHGSTVPYLLKEGGGDRLTGTVIQRIHYAWKQWLASAQMGDFLWRQNWDTAGATDLLVHNQPFDIYSIKHSCGPHPQVCLNFDFRKVSGEYTEYSLRAVAIDEENVRQKAELLLEQYGRTGSLFPHNVVLMPIGDDFRYDHDVEWDQQYRNYKRLFDYINANFQTYNAQVSFGTPSDYFKAVKQRMKDFKVLKGDFFVYSDIFSEGRPAYWSGYFTTRPYWKVLDRELEAELRSAEILYTVAVNRARAASRNSTVKILERDFEKLTRSRQSLALFQHHDAITGTSKALVMHDYALKMFEALQDSVAVQSYAVQTLLADRMATPSTRFILSDTDRESYEKLARKVPLHVEVERPRKVVVFNSLAQKRSEMIRLKVTHPWVRVKDADGKTLPFQVNPVWNVTEGGGPHLAIAEDAFELTFLAELPPLTLSTFVVEALPKEIGSREGRAMVYCRRCDRSPHFDVKGIQSGHVQLENDKFKLLLDGRTGFLKSVVDKATGKSTQCAVQFAAYPSAQFHSGAYLFMPDPNSRETERDVLEEYPGQKIVIVSGPISSELTVIYGNLLTHSVRIYQSGGPLGDGIYIENTVDFETPPKNRETELFMRLVTDISNGDPPEFHTDLNGFQTQKRVKVERIGIEGNYFPITTHAYIEDVERRVTLLVDHAQGAASWQPGWLEVMLDRRTLYDDSRGMGEGVVDNKKTVTRYWLLVETLADKHETYSAPTLLAHFLSSTLLYPPNVFVFDNLSEESSQPNSVFRSSVKVLNQALPCDVHLINLRTLSDTALHQFPSTSALMILQKRGFSCSAPSDVRDCPLYDPDVAFFPGTSFADLKTTVARTRLTGLGHLASYSDLDRVPLDPMNLLTLNITFVVS
ncbi:hypothetical protein AAG570_005114 [Ranatra chinensis]|uniref:Alpha-mannosidase n=1 Tax=Ranatra chinensis TaxID=642074 RepID=A0ABD0XZH6_9HEMI